MNGNRDRLAVCVLAGLGRNELDNPAFEVYGVPSETAAITESETALITLPSSFTNNSEARNFYYRKGNICMIGFVTPAMS